MKFCKDCKHCVTKGFVFKQLMCAHPVMVDRASGNPRLPCEHIRLIEMLDPEGLFGKVGKLWEAK